MKKYLSLIAVSFLLLIITNPVLAQTQDFVFSGNSEESYQCFDRTGIEINEPVHKNEAGGYFYCIDTNNNNEEVRAVLKPPRLQQLQVWFVRIVYAIWALVASLSFLLLLYLGYQYLLSRGDPTQIKAIRERIIKYIIGFALVFLAVPIITTLFRLLGVNNTVQCYSGLSDSNNVGIGFQFFFTDLCTDPNGIKTDPCDSGDYLNNLINEATGKNLIACTPPQYKSAATCPAFVGAKTPPAYGFCCSPSKGVWVVRGSAASCN